MSLPASHFRFFFFNDTATTEIYTLSLHDALPISELRDGRQAVSLARRACDLTGSTNLSLLATLASAYAEADRKSTRLNSSHDQISYAVFCLKKKKKRA